ncbi:MAG: hypothetical protein ACMG57_00245 [Candidatus Dojkabacteria bacterium]
MRTKIFIIYTLIFLSLFVFQIGGENNKLLIGFMYLTTFPLELRAISSAIRAYGIKHPLGKAFSLVFIGFFSATIAQGIWFYLRYILNVNPYPSISDAFFLIAYVFIFIGYFKTLREINVKWEKQYLKVLSFALLTALTLGILVFHYEISSIFTQNLPFLEKAISIGYGIDDLLLIVLALFILRAGIEYRKGELFKPWTAIFFAHFLVLIGDILFAIFSKEYANDIFPYNLISVLWFIANVLVILGYFGFSDVIQKAQVQMTSQVINKLKKKS